jgi:hypothetical protein
MKAKAPARFDPDAIRKQAGGKTFERGKEYFDEEVTTRIARMAKLRSKTEQENYLADIKTRHGRKRKFMSLLG